MEKFPTLFAQPFVRVLPSRLFHDVCHESFYAIFDLIHSTERSVACFISSCVAFTNP
jgi:hypothetical protein